MALTAWSTIYASQTDADSPINQVLMDSLRLDLNHLREVVYGDGSGTQTFLTAADGHNHDGVNSRIVPALADGVVTTAKIADGAITDLKMRNYQGGVAGSNAIFFSFTEKQLTTGVYTEAIRVRLARAGTLVIGFDLRSDSAGTALGRIYRNGVAVGVQQVALTLAGWKTFYEDISGWSPGDILQIGIYNDNGTSSMRYLSLYADQNFHDVEVLSTALPL